MNVIVVGTGYVGLPTGAVLAYLGHKVTFVDNDQNKIGILQQGGVPIFEPGLSELMALAATKLRFTSSYDEADIEDSDVVFIAVPTPTLKEGNADLSFVKAAADSIGERLGGHFTVVVNKSTVPVGSGNWVGALLREAYSGCKGCKPDGNYAMASNPEFLRQGSAIFDAFYPDRIIIGSEDPRAIEILINLYQPLLNQDFPAPDFLPRPKDFRAVPVVTCDLISAELTKYAANAFLALKISYINEISQLADKVGADITKVACGIGLDPRIGPRFLQAGIGWGGSCLGKDTSALISTAQEYNLAMPIVNAARDVNNIQRMWVVKTLLNELKILKGRTIALLGFAYKPLTDDLRDAPSLEIVRHLIQHGASVHITDPVALENARSLYPDLGVVYFDHPYDALRGADAVVLITEWSEFRDLNWEEIKISLNTPLVVDGRNFLPREDMEKLGFRYVGVGR